MRALYRKLYQFTTCVPNTDFTIHQYLLAARPAILFATGTVEEAGKNIQAIREILEEQPLAYIFISHTESDECGGLSAYLEAWSEVRVICSALTARELPGYGFDCSLFPVSGEKRLNDGELSLRFFDYPSEVHLQDGILCYEEYRDFLQFGFNTPLQ